MPDACAHLHRMARNLPRLRVGFTAADVPSNGIYFLFETGEDAHDGERIVRVGTHTGEGNLPKRLTEHLYAKNKNRSIFRKHIGRCLLRRDNHPYAQPWEYDQTSRADRSEYARLIDRSAQDAIENEVTRYMTSSFSFSVVRVDQKTNRLRYEEQLIGTLSKCRECKASSDWLGKWHPNPLISSVGIWNIQGHNGKSISCAEIEALFEIAKGSGCV